MAELIDLAAQLLPHLVDHMEPDKVEAPGEGNRQAWKTGQCRKISRVLPRGRYRNRKCLHSIRLALAVLVSAGGPAGTDPNGNAAAAPAKADRLHAPFAEACTTEINADSGVAMSLGPSKTCVGCATGVWSGALTTGKLPVWRTHRNR